MLLCFAAEQFALLGRGVNLCLQIEDHQLVAAAVTQHVDESVVAVHQVAVGSGDENALLHLLEQQSIFLFSGAALRGVPDNVDGAFLLAVLVGVGGG